MHRLVIALVVLLGLTGASVVAAFLFLSGASTDRAAALAPANTAAYVSVYLQPSAGQQMNLAELIGRLPGFADDASLDEKVDQVAQNLLGGTGIDYRDDVKPWIGGQVALAAWPADDGAEAGALVIADVKDQAAATDALPRLLGGGEPMATSTQSHRGVDIQVGEGGAYAFVEEMVVVGPDAAAVEAGIDAGAGSSLADRADFRETAAGLPEDHLASAFIDLAGAAEAGGGAELTGVSTAGLVLVAEPDGVRLAGTAPFDADGAEPSARAGFALGTEPSSLVDWMPADAAGEVIVFGARQTLEDVEAMLGGIEQGEEVAGVLSSVRALLAFGLGINLDSDILPLLDREVGVALTGFDGELPSGQLLLRPSDPDAAPAMLDRLADGLVAAGATRESISVDGLDEVEITLLGLPDTVDVAYAVVDEIVILGFSADDVAAAISAHESGEALGAQQTYASTFDLLGERAGTEAYADVTALVELLGAAAELPDDARDILQQVGSFGMTVFSRDDQIEFHAVLTVEDRQTD
jgi:hypothetical protein